MFKSGKLLRSKLGWFDSSSLLNINHFEEAETHDMPVCGMTVAVPLIHSVIDVD